MQTHDPDPSKRIPKSLGTDAALIGNYTLSDAAVALMPGVFVILLVQLVIPTHLEMYGYTVQDLTLPGIALAFAIGFVFVSLTPSYTSSLDWLATLIGFYRSPRSHTHDAAKQYTQIERVHPRRNAVERTDGALLGLIRIDPPSMALATDEEWRQRAADFRTLLDTVVEFPIQLYATTQPFPSEEYLSHYEGRLADPDVQRNPRLKRLIEEYIAWYARELDDRQMTIRDHYVVVAVSPTEIQFERETAAQKLTGVPVLGLFIKALLAPDQADQQATLFETLDQRLRRIETGLRDIEGCGVHRVDATEAARIIGEYWAGEPLDYGDLNDVFRTRPLVDRRST